MGPLTAKYCSPCSTFAYKVKEMSAPAATSLQGRSTNRVEVGQEIERQARTGQELRNDAERGQGSKLLMVLVRPLQLLFGRSDAEVVQDHVAFGVAVLGGLRRFFLRLRDDL